VLGKGWLSVHYKQVWDLLSQLLEQKPGGLSYALVVLAFCAAALSGLLPLSLLAVMTGSFFGFGAEVLITAAGGTGKGGLLSFTLARYGLRRPLERWVSKRISVARFDRAIAERNWRFVLLIRLSPVAPFSFISYAFGLTQVRLVDFLLGTAGSLPALTAYVYSGALSRNLFSVFAGQDGGPKWLQVSLLIAGILFTIMAVVVTDQFKKTPSGSRWRPRRSRGTSILHRKKN